MRTLILISLLLFGLQNWSAAQSSTEKQILETELKRFHAMSVCDTVLLENLLDADLIYLHSNGHEENKRQHLSAIATKTIVYQTMQREPNPRLRRYGKIALINGLVNVSGLYQGNPFSVKLRYVAVYRKRNSGWRLLNWQSTKVDTE